MSTARKSRLMESDKTMIVLNNDTVVCEDCYEPSPEQNADFGLWPMGYPPQGECSTCGYRLPVIDDRDAR